MGSTRKIVPELGDGPIFEVKLDVKECPGKYPKQ